MKSRGGKSQKRKDQKREDQKRKSQKKEDADARKGRKGSTMVPRKMKGALSHLKVPFIFWKNKTLKKYEWRCLKMSRSIILLQFQYCTYIVCFVIYVLLLSYDYFDETLTRNVPKYHCVYIYIYI